MNMTGVVDSSRVNMTDSDLTKYDWRGWLRGLAAYHISRLYVVEAGIRACWLAVSNNAEVVGDKKTM